MKKWTIIEVAVLFALGFTAPGWAFGPDIEANGSAQTSLGILYETGKGVPRDEMEALRWYLLAAEQENPMTKKNTARIKAKYRIP